MFMSMNLTLMSIKNPLCHQRCPRRAFYQSQDFIKIRKNRNNPWVVEKMLDFRLWIILTPFFKRTETFVQVSVKNGLVFVVDNFRKFLKNRKTYRFIRIDYISLEKISYTEVSVLLKNGVNVETVKQLPAENKPILTPKRTGRVVLNKLIYVP